MTALQSYLDTNTMTAVALAKRLNVSVSTITRIARGERKPSPDLAKAIEAETGISRAALLPDVFDGFTAPTQAGAAA